MIRYYGKPKEIGRKIQLELDDEKSYDFEIKEHRKKRSLNANAYAWELITQIAYVVGTTKEDVWNGLLAYKRYISVEKVATQYIKHGSTWFNQQCWNDDYTIKKEITTKDLADNMDFSDFR